MNTRQAIQPTNLPAVLAVSFSCSRNRFIAGLSAGLRCFRIDNCLITYDPVLPKAGGVAIAVALDDRYLAFVGGGRSPAEKPSVLVYWDALLGHEVTRFDLHEPVLGVRANEKYLIVLLAQRVVVFQYQEVHPEAPPTPPRDDNDNEPTITHDNTVVPNIVKAVYSTAENTKAIAALQGDLLVVPAQTTGQVQLIPLRGGSKRVHRAHQSAIRCITISDDGTLLATASEQGTLIRLFDLRSLDCLGEYRRGSDHAVIFNLAISPGNRWLAATSDKGTLHIFDLRPPDPAILAAAQEKAARERQQQHRNPFAPRILSDVRSIVSTPFYLGNDPPHWQGGPAYAWTMAPNGTRKKVHRPVEPIPGNPSGRPPKGVLAFAPKGTKGVSDTDDEGARLYIVGGGSEARWELFDLLPTEDGNWALITRGFRRYLTRQFVD
ncbi:hypothetical protein BAUCODRAFT_74997 [Baudoinia panamericana UAMH 10762]|uniref:Anaphase-promoting complex subunit 4 WD40 domain-containing protein n=1 Tax=Baudoinia panamericana (strain UAMH 10762) TaxID=717646 RepID=M2MQV9_BAUPA|nr:uncharacterized protein BAUCODRAFT_74997 [Baudoinia panamericana UAMH 10762]EMC93863.1 hypothetical protein BAUCODRAFT_74997 [Baudoinia panamericana UAMH 10762]